MRPTKSWIAALAAMMMLVPVSASAQPADGPPGQDRDRDPAPVIGTERDDAIPDRYVVVFDKDTNSANMRAAEARSQSRGADVHHRYRTAVR